MATKIPVQGEMEQISTPESFLGADMLIYRSVPEFGREVHVTGVGEAFISCHQNGFRNDRARYKNERATRFLSTRGLWVALYGDVVYLSKAEWNALSVQEGTPVPVAQGPAAPVPAKAKSKKASSTEPRVKILGNTFPVKDKIKALGGKWDANERLWSVPLSNAGTAMVLVEEDSNRGVVRDAVVGIAALFAVAAIDLKESSLTIAIQAYEAFFKTPSRHTSYPSKPSSIGAGINRRAGTCHRCQKHLEISQGGLFYSPKIINGREQGWLVECLPEHAAECKARESGSYDSPHLESQSALSTVTVSHVLVDDPNISDLFEDDKPKAQTNEGEVNALLVNILDDSDIPF